MGNFFAKHVWVHVCVGVDVNEGDGAILVLHSAEDWKCYRVVTTNGQGCGRRRGSENIFPEKLGDDVYGFFQVEGVDGDVAHIADVQTIERHGFSRHVVRPQHRRLLPHLPRPKARPRPQ